MRTLIVLLAAFTQAALAQDILSLVVPDRARVVAHHADHSLLIFLTNDGHLFATDVRPREDGTLPDLHPTLIADLRDAIGDFKWWTPVIGFMSAAQAAAANINVSAEDHLFAGDVVIGKQDFDGTQLVTIIPRVQIESELECLRALSFN